MRRYLLKRLIVAIPSLVIASLIVFTLPRLLPGDAVQLMLEEKAYGKDVDDLRHKLGLDRPIYIQYFAWVGNVLTGNLGESLWTKRTVTEELGMRLPITLLLGGLAICFAIVIAIPIEVLRQDYVRTAWAKGLREGVVVLKHSLKNALIPVVTILGIQLAQIFSGTVIIESIFQLPGMGRFLFDAILQRDYPVIQGINLLVVSMIVVLNLIVDLFYAVLDPRIRYS